MLENVKNVVKTIAHKGKIAIATAGAGTMAAVTAVVASAEGETGTTAYTVPRIADSVTGDMISGIMDQIFSLLPIILPAAVGILAFRKGLSWFLGFIRGL